MVARYVEVPDSKEGMYLSEEGIVFATLALSPLDGQSGLFQFPSEFVCSNPERAEWRYEPLALNPGEVVIWRGGRPMIRVQGRGGGYSITIMYE